LIDGVFDFNPVGLEDGIERGHGAVLVM